VEIVEVDSDLEATVEETVVIVAVDVEDVDLAVVPTRTRRRNGNQ